MSEWLLRLFLYMSLKTKLGDNVLTFISILYLILICFCASCILFGIGHLIYILCFKSSKASRTRRYYYELRRTKKGLQERIYYPSKYRKHKKKTNKKDIKSDM